MFEKFISFVTAIIIGLVGLIGGPKKSPPPDVPRFDLPKEVEPQKPTTPKNETPVQELTSDVPRLDLPKEVESQPPPAPAAEPKNQETNEPTNQRTNEPTAPAPEPTNQETNKPINQVKPRPIDLRSVVGLACDFENKNTGEKTKYRGSGVIIREGAYSKGTYILTNRHVVDLAFAKKLSGDEDVDQNLKLTECKVYVFTAERNILPEERYPYPYYDLRNVSGLQYDFKARLAYLPATQGLSENEGFELDYAILEVTGKNNSKYFEHENPRLPAAPILIPSPMDWTDVITESRVVMPGYAFQQEGSGSFEEFRLLTKDGIMKDIYAGDKGLEHTPISMMVEVPPDAYGGRSGSPIFYKGYLIGLVATKALPMPNSGNFESPQPAITGIIENMKSYAATRDIFENINYFE